MLPMPENAQAPETFRTELGPLVEQFGRNIGQYKSNAYDEAGLRQEFLNPLLRALGWDVENKAGFIPQHGEVEIESRTEVAGRHKRADHLFRTDRQIDALVYELYGPSSEEIGTVEGKSDDSQRLSGARRSADGRTPSAHS